MLYFSGKGCSKFPKKVLILIGILSCLSEPEKDDFDSCSVSLQAPDSFDDTYYDVTAYINSYPSDSVQRKILSMYFYQDKSDAQIARKLKLSRQYVNRMKKKLILKYISENK